MDFNQIMVGFIFYLTIYWLNCVSHIEASGYHLTSSIKIF